MSETTKERAKRLSQWFTPGPLATKIAQWSRVDGLRIIEPAAGAGALVSAFAAAGAASIVAVEIDPRLAVALRRRIDARGGVLSAIEAARIAVLSADFLKLRLGQLRTADLVGHNPPYEDGADGRFIGRSTLFAPRGVALVRVNALVGLKHYVDAWRRVRVTRIAYLVRRPEFEGLLANRGPRSDFCVVEYVEHGSPWMDGRCTVEHWPESWQ